MHWTQHKRNGSLDYVGGDVARITFDSHWMDGSMTARRNVRICIRQWHDTMQPLAVAYTFPFSRRSWETVFAATSWHSLTDSLYYFLWNRLTFCGSLWNSAWIFKIIFNISYYWFHLHISLGIIILKWTKNIILFYKCNIICK